jgi:bile acid-coenzyme A ligase
VHAIVQVSTEYLSADQLAEFLKDRLDEYKIPRTFEFVTYALRNDAGKARRSAFRDARVAKVSI